MPYMNTGDAEVWYEVTGDGPPLLLIAGIASDVASWAPIVPALSERHRLILFDNRGAGRTRFEGVIKFDDIVGDTLKLLDFLDIGRTDVAGHSMGGMLALRLAEKEPQRVGRIVAAACTADPEAKSGSLLDELCGLYEREDDPAIFFRHLFHWLFAPPFFADPAVVSEAAQTAVTYEHRQSPGDLRRQISGLSGVKPLDPSKVEHETLLLLPELDLLVPPNMARNSLGGLPNTTETIVAGAGHSVHWDRPEEAVIAILDFLAESGRRTTGLRTK